MGFQRVQGKLLMKKVSLTQSAGFTLVELIVAILISAIISIGVIGYIADSVEGFLGSSNRNQLASSGRVVVDRLALELHNSLPNSVRVSAALPNGDQCLEFIPFTGATTYLDVPFTGSGGTDLQVIDFNPTLTADSPAGVYAVVYPINTVDVYESQNPGPIALVDEIVDEDEADGVVDIVLDSTHRFSRRSPVDRVYITGQPVSYCIVGSRLFRYQDYGFEATQCTTSVNSCEVGSPLVNRSLPSGLPQRVLISDGLNNSGVTAFRVIEATLRRNALVSMELNFTDQGDVVRMKHEVLLRNVP